MAKKQTEAPAAAADQPQTTEVVAPAEEKKAGPIRVVATRAGYYANVHRVRGDEFSIRAEADFSATWMKRK